MKSKLMFIASLASVSAIAGATWVQESFAGDPKNDPRITSPISVEELKDRCSKPGQFNEQHSPKSISVVCTDVYTTWVAGVPGEVPLTGSRMVTTALVSDKWHVNSTTESVPVIQKSGSCLRFEEVENRLSIQEQLSCDQLLNMKGGLTDYCVAALERGKGQNSKLVEMNKTGHILDQCPPGTESGRHGKPDKPGKPDHPGKPPVPSDDPGKPRGEDDKPRDHEGGSGDANLGT